MQPTQPPATLGPLLYTVIEAAALLGVGRTTIYELSARGEVEVVHIGRAARVPAASLDAFVEALRCDAARPNS